MDPQEELAEGLVPCRKAESLDEHHRSFNG